MTYGKWSSRYAVSLKISSSILFFLYIQSHDRILLVLITYGVRPIYRENFKWKFNNGQCIGGAFLSKLINKLMIILWFKKLFVNYCILEIIIL
jgi:hypothetical protein